jgi:general secretion pathway protein E/type IV pilus assembly protein PilB
MMRTKSGQLRIGELMLQHGLISQDQLNIALKEQLHTKLILGKQLEQ